MQNVTLFPASNGVRLVSLMVTVTGVPALAQPVMAGVTSTVAAPVPLKVEPLEGGLEEPLPVVMSHVNVV